MSGSSNLISAASDVALARTIRRSHGFIRRRSVRGLRSMVLRTNLGAIPTSTGPVSANAPFAGAMKCVAGIALALGLTAVLPAQDPFGGGAAGDNPFGGPADATSPFGGFGEPAPAEAAPAAAAAATASPTSEEDPNPIIRLLRETPPQTPKEMAEGLTWVVRLKRWDEVRRLLDQIVAKQWDLPQLAELASAGGESLWFRLSVDEAGLSEEQRKLLDSIVAAQGTLARDPAWLDGWIEKLAHPQPGARRLAQLRLREGGPPAITRLLERLFSNDAGVDAGMLAGTIAEFGSSGRDALRAACLVKDPQRAARVYLGIAEIPGSEFSSEVAAGLQSTLLTSEHRAALAEIVQRRFSKVPTPAAIEKYLAERFASRLEDYQQSRADQLVVIEEPIWRPTADGKSVAQEMGPPEQRELEQLARLAAHRLNLTVATTDDLVDSTAVILQRAYRVQPGLQAATDQAAYLADLNRQEAHDASFWIRVFDRASELQMHGAAVRSIQKLALEAPGHYLIPLDFLTRLLGDSRPVIRYLALQQIAELDPQQSFGGAEKALEVAVEMARLNSGPHVLVVGRSADLRQAAQQQLEQQVAAQVTTAESARSALLALDGLQPIEMVLIVDRMSDQSVFELLQRLRTAKRSRALPIAVLTDELYQHERRLIGQLSGVVSAQLSRGPQQMQQVIDKLMEQLDTQPFSSEDRNRFAQIGGEFLSKIASDRDQYAFYPLNDWRSELGGIGRNMSIASRMALLAALGSADSQMQLVALASSSSLTAAERLQAAQEFSASVDRFGMNLGRDGVLKVYDVYNALGPNDPATAASLGMVLDAIEARTR